MFCEKDVLRNFTKFTGKHLCQILFFNDVTGLRPATLFLKNSGKGFFSCEFCKISKNSFSSGLQLYFKKTLARVFFSCEFCEISKNSFSYKTHLVAASGLTCIANSSNLSIQDLLCLLISC